MKGLHEERHTPVVERGYCRLIVCLKFNSVCLGYKSFGLSE